MPERLRIPKHTERWLLCAIAVMVAVDVALAVLQFTPGVSLPKSLVDALDLALEGSVPTWFSSAQLLVAAMLLAVIAVSKSRTKDPQRFAWIALAIGFTFLSLDETASIHEEWGLLLKGSVKREGIFFFRWTIVALALLPVLVVAFWKFLASLPRRTRIEMIVAGAIFVGGAVGMELVTGYVAAGGGQGSFFYAMLNAVENGLEMLGIALFIGTLVRYLAATQTVAQLPVALDVATLRRALVVTVVVVLGLSVGTVLLARTGFSLPPIAARSLNILEERNVPTWFSSMLLVVCALVAAFIAEGSARSRTASHRGWWALASILLLHSASEVAQLQETFTAWVRSADVGTDVSWNSVGIVLVAAPMASVWPWVRQRAVELRRSILMAAVIYYGGSWICPIIIELLGALGIHRGSGTLAIGGEVLEIVGAAYLVVVLGRELATDYRNDSRGTSVASVTLT